MLSRGAEIIRAGATTCSQGGQTSSEQGLPHALKGGRDHQRGRIHFMHVYILEECKALWGSPDRVAICRYECGESDGAWTHTLLLRDTTPMQYT